MSAAAPIPTTADRTGTVERGQGTRPPARGGQTSPGERRLELRAFASPSLCSKGCPIAICPALTDMPEGFAVTLLTDGAARASGQTADDRNGA